jgi:AraC family transcriptional regulator of adaptative response/methylated-DNA-[protein]-cysteine methyltransferase
VGVSPKRFLQFLTANQAKKLLRHSLPVLDTALQVGVSGPGRLHDLLINTEAMTPGEYARHGAGQRLQFGMADSPFGVCLIAMSNRGICHLQFINAADSDDSINTLHDQWFKADWVRDDRNVVRVANQIFEKKSGRLLLHLKGTNFQLKVWEALLRIPEQSVISYQDLARRIGEPNATRAVANAVGANPFAYLIPCHRVIRDSGALGGYRWGLDRKAIMLAQEWLNETALRQANSSK